MTEGGSYIIQADGRRKRVEEPTRSHAQGDMPRTAEGEVIGPDGLVVPPANAAPPSAVPEPAPADPAEPPDTGVQVEPFPPFDRNAQEG